MIRCLRGGDQLGMYFRLLPSVACDAAEFVFGTERPRELGFMLLGAQACSAPDEPGSSPSAPSAHRRVLGGPRSTTTPRPSPRQHRWPQVTGTTLRPTRWSRRNSDRASEVIRVNGLLSRTPSMT